MESLLLHICCGPCAAHPISKLIESFELSLFFYGPNIQPREEYARRLSAAAILAERQRVELIEAEYDPESWLEMTRDWRDEPEGGKRCSLCYRQRLARTARAASEKGFKYFATSLTLSPHKPAAVIDPLGEEAARQYGVKFLAEDFKKKDGFRHSCKLAKEYGLYRQTYCGCQYSL